MNVANESEGEIAQVFNGQLFHDITIVKEDEESGKKTLQKKCLAHLCGRTCGFQEKQILCLEK